MMLNYDDWWFVQAIAVACSIIFIIYIKTKLRITMFQTSSVPTVKGNLFLFYLMALFAVYKQSRFSLPAWSLAFQRICANCLLYGKQGLFGANLLLKPAIVFYKPKSVEAVMRSLDLIEKGSEYKLLVPWLGKGLVTSGGTKWRKHRKLLTPTLHFSILENFVSMFQEQSEVLVSKLQLRVHEPWIHALPLISSCTLEIICLTAMGISLNAQNDENCDYSKAIHEVQNTFMYRVLRPWLYPDIIFYLTSHGRKFKTNIETVQGLSEKVIKEKKIEMTSSDKLKSKSEYDLEGIPLKKRMPLLELLLQYHLKDSTFTETDVRDEVNTFMFAGHDTTAVTVNWVLYCLGVYQEIQKKVHKELEDIFGREDGTKISLEALAEMKYLECVIKETMRLYPTIPMILRENRKPFQVFEHNIQPGHVCALFIYLLHRDPESFPDPEVFSPDRFLPENSKDRHPYAYVPFSAGPRNCIGQRFAMMEMKIILSTILRRFHVTSLDNRDKVILYPNMVTLTATPLRLRFDLL